MEHTAAAALPSAPSEVQLWRDGARLLLQVLAGADARLSGTPAGGTEAGADRQRRRQGCGVTPLLLTAFPVTLRVCTESNSAPPPGCLQSKPNSAAWP